LWHGNRAEDVIQLLIHCVHLVSGGCKQSVKERGHRDHILDGPSEGRVLPPPPPHGWPLCPLCIEHRLAVVLFSQMSLNGLSLADEFAPSLCGPVLDVRI
jgi:hypothetical protein